MQQSEWAPNYIVNISVVIIIYTLFAFSICNFASAPLAIVPDRAPASAGIAKNSDSRYK